MMNSKEIKEEKRLLSCNRDKRNILVIENLEYAFNTLKENPEKYDYEMKKILVENLYENIKFLFAFPDLKVMFEKMGFSKDMNLNNKKDVDLLYNYLVELVKTHYGDYSLAFTIYNHKSFTEKI